MALRPPIFARTLTSLSRGGSIAPRLMAPALITPSAARFNSSDSPFSRPRQGPPQSTLGLGSFLGDSLLSRPRPAPSAPEDPLAAEFPTYTGIAPTFGSAATTTAEENMYHLVVYATKHNTHITFTKPNKDIVLSLSCGNVGFKKATRGTFEAAYQLSCVMLQRMDEKGHRPKNLEIIFRDFGPGRDAFTKVLLGKEGKGIRGSVRRVTDASRLKFGGTRSRAIRRL